MSRGKSKTSGTPAIGSMRLGPRRSAVNTLPPGGRGVGALFVAADATGRLAGLHGQEALHALDGQVVLVQRHEEEAAQGGQFEVSGAVRLDRHGADDAFQREGAAVADRLHAAGVVDGHGQGFEHQQLLDLAPLDAVHVAAVVDVGQHQAARSRGRGPRAAESAVRAGAAAAGAARGIPASAARSAAGSWKISFGWPRAVHDHERRAARRQKEVFGEGPRVAEIGLAVTGRANDASSGPALGSTTVIAPACSRLPCPGRRWQPPCPSRGWAWRRS